MLFVGKKYVFQDCDFHSSATPISTLELANVHERHGKSYGTFCSMFVCLMSITFNRCIICFPSSWTSSRFNHICIHNSAGDSFPVFPSSNFGEGMRWNCNVYIYTSMQLRLFCGGPKWMIWKMTVFQINKQGLRVADIIASFPHEACINPYGSGFCPESNHVWFNFITLLEPKTYKHLSMNGF